MSDASEVTISRVGAQGDGVADTGAAPVFVPFALPGERWRLRAGEEPEQLSVSPDRARPPCRHFGTCGGCVAQHMSDATYADWKRNIVVEAFAHRGITADVQPLRRISAGSRRRAYFGIARSEKSIAMGFREEGRHKLVDLEECVILDPRIVSAMPHLRALADRILPKTSGTDTRVLVTSLDNGLDVSFEASGKDLSADTRQALAAMSAAAGIVRLSIGGEPLMSAAPPMLVLGGATVKPPPGVFLQAVPEAEQVMSEIIMKSLPKVKLVADLFCGLGTFTYALARRSRVIAVDSDKQAIAVLTDAAKGAAGLKPVTAKVRDLFREPLSARELDGVDAAVFDPPRAGAQAQCERLAKSKVKTVVAVSCNPATLARDARILLDGGYSLKKVHPIDQFTYAAHLETIAVFSR